MIKRDSLDAIFSDVIRESHDWTCVNCNREFPERKGQDIHASHFYSRQFNATRWFPDNAVALCGRCHDFVGKHPDAHTDLIRSLLGAVRYQCLKDRKQRIYRYRPADKKAMRMHFAAELERIRAERMNGVTGYIEVYAYDE